MTTTLLSLLYNNKFQLRTEEEDRLEAGILKTFVEVFGSAEAVAEMLYQAPYRGQNHNESLATEKFLSNQKARLKAAFVERTVQEITVKIDNYNNNK